MIQKGSKVSIHYTLTVDGQVVDSSEGKEPLSYVHGEGQIIPGLESELANFKQGDKKNVKIPPEKGYGPYNPEAVHKVARTAFKESEGMKAGDIVSGQVQGQPFQAVVSEVGEKDITLNLNHPLAGKTLNFDIEVVSVESSIIIT